MTSRGIEGVCFDATGTLFVLRESVGTTYARHARAAGVSLPAWRLDDAFARVLRHGPSLPESVLALGPAATRAAREAAERDWWRDRVRQTFQATDSTVRFADADGFFAALFAEYTRAEAWQLRPGIAELLATLKRQDLPLGVLSYFDHRLPDLLEALALKDFFSHIEIPSQSGLAKPDRRACEAVAAALGRPLAQLAYVGDDAPAILEALAAHGLTTCAIRSDADIPPLAEKLTRAATESTAGAAKLAPTTPPDDPARAESKAGARAAK